MGDLAAIIFGVLRLYVDRTEKAGFLLAGIVAVGILRSLSIVVAIDQVIAFFAGVELVEECLPGGGQAAAILSYPGGVAGQVGVAIILGLGSRGWSHQFQPCGVEAYRTRGALSPKLADCGFPRLIQLEIILWGRGPVLFRRRQARLYQIRKLHHQAITHVHAQNNGTRALAVAKNHLARLALAGTAGYRRRTGTHHIARQGVNHAAGNIRAQPVYHNGLIQRHDVGK